MFTFTYCLLEEILKNMIIGVYYLILAALRNTPGISRLAFLAVVDSRTCKGLRPWMVIVFHEYIFKIKLKY
jgi:hypothetical protein